VRSCERVTLTRVVVAEGMGVDGNPVREVTYWYDDDGWLIARRDGWEEAQDSKEAWMRVEHGDVQGGSHDTPNWPDGYYLRQSSGWLPSSADRDFR
jgi:hypothetical protein